MSESIHINNYIPIPPIFYPEGSDKPFCNCKVCGKELMESGEPYLIEKAYGQDLEKEKRQVIFEFVYCFDCVQEVHETLSVESRVKIAEYMKQNTNLEQRDAELKKHELFDVDIWLHNCVVKNQSIDEVKEFQIYALCQGGDLLFHQAPYMICGDAVDEIAGLLSNKSLDILNDLMTDLIDLPPEFSELFKTRHPILI
ncbi:hypothetical protein [Carboxylicivirga sp. N1Y90]|uniref:hypothetical protein n=1 Tax=Carboxylicivirga fragile TaxID=3417571 RepID=UPI003D32E928|nr:hypothetical protein [Marinilabiliaceae bacterium N1Y90]